MKALTSFQRKDILLQIASSLKSREEEIAHVIVSEVGKPIRDARAEIGRAIDTFTVSAEEAVRAEGSYTKYDISARNAGFQGVVSRFPIGLISMIVPFNFPLNLAAHKVGPAIAAGCPFVLKPSDRTPISAIILGEILAQTQMPENSFSILPCDPADAPLFSTDPRIKALSFTGSAAVGWKLKQNSGKMRVLLELGGNAAVIVDEAVNNMDHVASRVAWGSFYSQGQSCISVQRVFIHEKVFDAFVDKLTRATAALKVGDPYDPETIVGPLITENDAVRIEKWVNNAVARGAKILAGGKRNGAFYAPTIVTNVPADSELACEEAFGPVVVLQKVATFQEACSLVNKSNYGLQAGVFTNDLNRAFYAYEHLEVGGVVINEVSAARVDSMPVRFVLPLT